MPILESSYYQIDEIDDHAMEPPPIERGRACRAGEVDERLLKSVIKSKMGHPSWPSLPPHSVVRLSALGPCLKERKNGRGGSKRAGEGSIDRGWSVARFQET